MALKVMLSSVRRGLADVRDAVAPVIKILRYDVIRFETVVKTPVPARAACVAMVEDSDIYLLILGEEYGDPMPGTGLAPPIEANRGRSGVLRKQMEGRLLEINDVTLTHISASVWVCSRTVSRMPRR